MSPKSVPFEIQTTFSPLESVSGHAHHGPSWSGHSHLRSTFNSSSPLNLEVSVRSEVDPVDDTVTPILEPRGRLSAHDLTSHRPLAPAVTEFEVKLLNIATRHMQIFISIYVSYKRCISNCLLQTKYIFESNSTQIENHINDNGT